MKERAFKDPVTGKYASTPWDRETAIAEGYTRYMDRDGCPNCIGSIGIKFPKVRYVEDGQCVECFNKRIDLAWSAWECGMPGRPEPWVLTADQARAAGVPWILGSQSYPRACQNGPHLRLTHIRTGRCVECENIAASAKRAARGPRAAARAEGRQSYVPTDPCPDCGQRADRNVVTNKCSGCTAAHDARRTPDSIMMEQCPDMVVSRDDARALGIGVYRTGEACRRGHTGYRYVLNGACIDCLRGK